MNTIWKIPLHIEDTSWFHLPARSALLHAGLDPTGLPCLWARVDPDKPLEARKVYIVGTGGRVPDDALHFASFVHGSFMWHVFL